MCSDEELNLKREGLTVWLLHEGEVRVSGGQQCVDPL